MNFEIDLGENHRNEKVLDYFIEIASELGRIASYCEKSDCEKCIFKAENLGDFCGIAKSVHNIFYKGYEFLGEDYFIDKIESIRKSIKVV